MSDLAKSDRQSLVTRSIAAIHRISGLKSSYAIEVKRVLKIFPFVNQNISPIVGIVQALRDDLNAGYIQNLVELAHGEVFADFLEMALHLSDSGYKDAAAIIAGSTLESHIRELCHKHGISVEEVKKDGSTRPLKTDRLNADLAKAAVYSKLDQKSITAWLDLRNKATHGKYNEYSADQVILLIEGIRGFITRVPA